MEIRTKILDAAVRVFAETGFRGATTRRIATEAGVNEITIFRHFGSKSALLELAIGRNAVNASAPKLPRVPIDPEAELSAWAGQQLDALREQRTLIRTCMGESQEHPEMMPPCGTQPARAADALCEYSDCLREHGFTQAAFDSR
ncbi:MAG: helix-turn-helix transcriptional regulator, partial [Gemmatimonadales bacterium]|nr:helix-turn-helix transcriptional regulator [Gemmatimonadales bacterium]